MQDHLAFLDFAFLTVEFHLVSQGIKDVSPQKPFNPCDSVTPRDGSVSEHVLSCGGKAGTQPPAVSPFILLVPCLSTQEDRVPRSGSGKERLPSCL